MLQFQTRKLEPTVSISIINEKPAIINQIPHIRKIPPWLQLIFIILYFMTKEKGF